jgi:4-hydroxy-4-methyl-2-oxoglutarate aldolase
VVCGGRLVSPGDLVIGDDDGLVCLAPAVVRGRIEDAEAKVRLEAEWISSLTGGRSLAETFELPRPKTPQTGQALG